MTARSVEMHRLQELVRLHRLKTSAREVCRLLGMGRTTEWHYRQALENAGLLAGDPADLPSVEVIRAATGRAAQRSIAQQEATCSRTRCPNAIPFTAMVIAAHLILVAREHETSKR